MLASGPKFSWTPVRAFLCLYNGLSGWRYETTQDLEAVRRAWKLHLTQNDGAGLLHIGFDAIQAEAFDNLAKAHPGKLLLTVAAKHALPSAFRSSVAPVGEVQEQPIFLALTGWGYNIEEVSLPPRPAPETKRIEWLATFVATAPQFESSLVDAGIVDDETYFAHESSLDRELRVLLGKSRIACMLTGEEADPCELARVAPPWLQNREFSTMTVSVRSANVLRARGIKDVADLGRLTMGEMLKLQNFGRTSAADLHAALKNALDQGPLEQEWVEETVTQRSLLENVQQSLMVLDTRVQDILRCRMGFDGSPQTLAEIGDRLNLVRERIRQIEAKALQSIGARDHWPIVLAKRLNTLLSQRVEPLRLLDVQAVDPWFDGVADKPSVLPYLVDAFETTSANFILVEGVTYLGRIGQEQWNVALSQGRELLAAAPAAGWTEAHCLDALSAFLPDDAQEFRHLLWERLVPMCHFSDNPDGERLLLSYGRGTEQLVQAILQDADRPLHYQEIFQRANARGREDVDVRRIHQAAGEVAFLFGRGKFGLAKHIPLSGEDMVAIAEEAEAIVAEGPQGRQWHAYELLALLIDSGSHSAVQADHYLLSIALLQSSRLVYLGRLVWASAEADTTAQGRIDIRQTIIDILRDAGEPLRPRTILERLKVSRGIGVSVQLQPYWPLIRVGPSLWGLADRDVPLTPSQQTDFIAKLITVLEWRGKGIHLSELWQVMQPVPGMSAEAAFSLAVLDDHLSVGIGQFVYLAEWGEPRRLRLSEVVESALQYLARPATFEEIAALVQARFDRPVDRTALSASINGIGSFDAATDLWSFDKAEDEEPPEI